MLSEEEWTKRHSPPTLEMTALLDSRLEVGISTFVLSWSSVRASVGERAISQLLGELAVVGADRAGRLAHVDGRELLLGIDPEIGSGIARPHELTR